MVEPGNTIRVLLASVLVLLAGCASPEKVADPGAVSRPQNRDVLAQLGGQPLTQADFEQFLGAHAGPRELQEIRTNTAARQSALEDWLDFKVQLAKARQQGLDQLPTFRKAAELMEMKLLVREQMDENRSLLVDPASVSSAEIASFYQTRTNLFQLSEGVHPGNRQPLEKVRNEIATQIANEKNGAFNREFIEKLKQDFQLQVRAEAQPDASLLDTRAVATNAVIATMGSTRIRESDFQWFLKDAFRAEQRYGIFSQAHAREQLLNSYLNMRLMEAEARKSGLDKKPGFRAELSMAVDRLLIEFLQEREGTAPWKLPGSTEEERRAAFRNYMNQLRQEMHLVVLPVASAGEVQN